jgi:hypothetical protein
MTDVPSAVRRGVYALAVATIATGVYIWSYTETWDAAARMSPWMWTLFLVTNGLFVWLLVLTWRGRNWARWATVIWCALGALAILWSSLFSDAGSILDHIVQSVIVAIEVWGCYQLLSRPASSWFRPSAAA